MHVASPYIDILRYGGEIPQPGQKKRDSHFCCPDVEPSMYSKSNESMKRKRTNQSFLKVV